MSTFVLPLADPKATLEIVGGKGMSLAKMAQAGLPVPGGFHVTTDAYRRFVTENDIQPRILAALEGANAANAADLERISQQISDYFNDGLISSEIKTEIAAAYAALPNPNEGSGVVSVAVRSSATAEDLPGASFAGQQETYLNICGEDAVLAAVKKCWASLWTARAIAYRARQGIGPEAVALAVVVQQLVVADAAGVLFTANPVSGKRDEMMITATWGLGEAIVGGLVTPDTMIVNHTTGQLIHRETSEKQVMTVRTESGTREQPVPKIRQKEPVLSDAQAAELARHGLTIEQLYGMPMDIEWALAGENIAIVQARPITTKTEPSSAALKWERSNPKVTLARGSFAEFIPEPVSTLFATLAVPIAEEESQKMMAGIYGPGETDAYVFEVVNCYVYAGMAMTPKLLLKATFGSLGQVKEMLKSSYQRWVAAREAYRTTVEQWQQDPAALPASRLVAGARELFRAAAKYYTVAQTGPIPIAPMSEMVFGRFYKSLIKSKRDPEPSIFMLGSETIPLRAEKSLYDLSMWVKGQAELAETILRTPTETILANLNESPVPAPYAGEFPSRFAEHLSAFGHTLYDMDFAKPIPADDPSPLIEAIKAYLAGNGVSPYERQKAQVERRVQAEQAILQRLDPLRKKWFTGLLRWTQKNNPDREDCIADMGLAYPQLRRILGELGKRLAAGEAIAQPDDVYWLEAKEVDTLAAALDAGEALQTFTDQVERRRNFCLQARRAIPPVSIPEKSFLTRFLAHDNPDGSVLKGFSASTGKVTARACVLHGPEEFGNMRPGDVIVAVTTTPAWTPLFAMASAVVTDIGGPLSHSSIVAREYGIPAVMATGVGSKRIQNGQTITVDGTNGIVTLQE